VFCITSVVHIIVMNLGCTLSTGSTLYALRDGDAVVSSSPIISAWNIKPVPDHTKPVTRMRVALDMPKDASFAMDWRSIDWPRKCKVVVPRIHCAWLPTLPLKVPLPLPSFPRNCAVPSPIHMARSQDEIMA
jgi:hypothetical protein